jgi:O-antigen ligase
MHFFRDVHLYELLYGRGPKGSWYWPIIRDYYQYFDNGYLWMLFMGGVPLLLGYLALVIRPATRLTRARLASGDAASVFMMLFWALALTGLSTFTLPSVAFTSFFISLLAGRCHALGNDLTAFGSGTKWKQ